VTGGFSSDMAVIGGLGMCGTATRLTFDIKDYYDLKGQTMSLEEIAATKRYVFLSLPTPTSRYGHNYLYLYKMIKRIHELNGREKIFIIRSTVVPGTCQKIMWRLGIVNIVHNPEFFTERTMRADVKHPDLIVLGSMLPEYAQEVSLLYKHRYPKVKQFVTDTKTAEMVKLAVNTFYALKVTFANQIYDVCQREEIDYSVVRDSMYSRRWVGKNHLDVWHKGFRGYGGKCLPKDMKAFNRAFKVPLLLLADQLNDKYVSVKTNL